MPFEDLCWFYFVDGVAAASKKKMRGIWCAKRGRKISDDRHEHLVTSQHTRKTEEGTVFTGNAPPLGIIAEWPGPRQQCLLGIWRWLQEEVGKENARSIPDGQRILSG